MNKNANELVIEKGELANLKELVRARLASMPPEVSFSIGSYGDFTRDQLIEEVENGTKIGLATIEMEVNFIKRMPKLLAIMEK